MARFNKKVTTGLSVGEVYTLDYMARWKFPNELPEDLSRSGTSWPNSSSLFLFLGIVKSPANPEFYWLKGIAGDRMVLISNDDARHLNPLLGQSENEIKLRMEFERLCNSEPKNFIGSYYAWKINKAIR